MTRTIPSDIRKTAKKLAREGRITHQAALDRLARENGHAGWSGVLAAKRTQSPSLPLITALLSQAWGMSGTDVHIDPIGETVDIAIRVHGRRRHFETIDADQYASVRREILSCMEGHGDGVPSEGRTTIHIEGRDLDVGLASIPKQGGRDKLVLRIPDRHISGLGLHQLGIRDLDGWLRICRSGPGIVVVSGTASSGKSTTVNRTVEFLRNEGIDVVADHDEVAMRHDRIGEYVTQAEKRTVILEIHGTSLENGLANAMALGVGNAALSSHLRGGMHQGLVHQPSGPRVLETMIMPWP